MLSSTAEQTSTTWLLWVLAFTGIGLGIRLVGINAQSFVYDEAVTKAIVANDYGSLALGWAKDNGNPPAYWIAAKAWATLFGRSETAMRSLAVIFAAATIPMLAVLGRTLEIQAAGLIAAALYAISPLSLELSTEARCYTMLHLLAVGSTLAFVLWVQKRHRAATLGYILTTWLCCLTHYYALLLPFIHSIAYLSISKDRRPPVSHWLGILTALVALGLFWAPAFFAQLSTPGNSARYQSGWHLQFLATPLVFAFGRTLVWREEPSLLLALASLAAIIWIWLPAAIGLFRLRHRRFEAVLLSAWLLLPVVAPLVAALTGKPIYATRYGSLGLPALALLAGVGLAPPHFRMRSFVVAAGLLLTAWSLGNFFTHPSKDDWRNATAYVLANGKDHLLLFDADHHTLPFRHYASKLGELPKNMFGVIGGPSADGLSGVALNDPQPAAKGVRNLTETALAQRELWLVMCTPNSTIADYETFFADHGYECSLARSFYQISIYRVIRAANVDSGDEPAQPNSPTQIIKGKND